MPRTGIVHPTKAGSQLTVRRVGCTRRIIIEGMPGHECYHCKQWIEAGEAHDCWTTTEAALTAGLSDDLREAWERLRETAAEFGEQRIYASHHSIMFARRSCYFFVRPRARYLELCLFLPRAINAPQIRRVDRASSVRLAHLLRITHRDEVEAPITDWLREAYEANVLRPAARAKPAAASRRPRASASSQRTRKSTSSASASASGNARRTLKRAARRNRS